MRKRDKKVYLKDILDAGVELLQLKNDAIDVHVFLSNNYYYRTAEGFFKLLAKPYTS